MCVTLLTSLPFNDGAMDSVQTWNDAYLWSKFSIYGGIFRIRSVYWSGYRFSWSGRLSSITRCLRSGSGRRCIERVARGFISSECWNFSYIFNVLISNGDQDIDFAVRASVTLFRSSPFNDGVTDSVETWNNVYLWTTFWIYGGCFWFRSGYRFLWSGRLSLGRLRGGSSWRCIERVLRCSI